MIRKLVFWLHLSVGVATGLFIFIMAATGVVLSFERQIVEFVDRDMRFVAVPNDAHPRPLNQLLEVVRRAGLGDLTAVILRSEPRASTQVSIGRGKTVYIDPYSDAVLGVSSSRAHEFFFGVERLHRALGAPLGQKTAGHWLAASANLLFAILILLGIVLWLPRKWTRKAMRASVAFRSGLRGRARDWNWHNVLGIWCALPLLVIALSGVVMSFEWANTLLFQLAGSAPPNNRRDGGERRPPGREFNPTDEPNYADLFTAAKGLNPDWRTITLNLVRDASGPVSAAVDTGTGGEPQKRTQYLLDRHSGTVLRTMTFAQGSPGQKLRTFVRFGHTGEYGGMLGQAMAALASLGACVLVYTGLALSIRRLAAALKRKRTAVDSVRNARPEEALV